MKKKIIFIVIDGLGDRPIKALNNKTPLEAAKTLNLDFLAKKGLCGLVFPFRFPYQKFPRSDSAHLALFGYNPKTYYLGRGPYEAAGIGMKIKKGDLIFRVNFGTVNKNLKIVDRRAGRINNIEPLVKSLSGITIDGVKFLINNSWGHRAVLILRAKNISEKISNGDIKKIGIKALKIVPLEESKKAIFTAEVLNKFLAKSYQILNNHPLNKKREKKNLLPANYLLIRGVGKLKKTISFKKKYKRNASCIAGGSLYKGIAKVLGMDLVKVKGADGSPNTNLKGKINAVKKALKKYNFVFLHIKAADNLAEDGKFKKKKEFIEKIDKNLKPLLNLKNILIIVTGDHSTCCELKRHCKEPVPILIFGGKGDNVKEFSEKACKKGKLGKFKAIKLMEKIL